MQYSTYLSKRRTVCPQCGKRSFSNYLSTDTNQPVADGECGRCNRQNSCGYHKPPREFPGSMVQGFRGSRVQRFKGSGVQGFKGSGVQGFKGSGVQGFKGSRVDTTRKTNNISIIPTEAMLATIGDYERNNLARFLHGVFDKPIGSANVDAVLRSYNVGTDASGRAIFWQVDDRQRVRTGKIMAYDAATGRRIKNTRESFDWVHSDRTRYAGFELRQAYFGAHIAADKPDAVIWLMESEKAALITAMWLLWVGGSVAGQFIPVACGGCQGLKTTRDCLDDPCDRVQLLRDRKVTLFPDQGKCEEWDKIALGLHGFAEEVYVNTMMERADYGYAVSEGDGPDDILLANVRDGDPWILPPIF